jgi:LPS export ABC transporter protein LptC
MAGLVALGTLAACSSGKTPPLAVRNALADSADQVLYHTKSVLTDNGVMKAEVHADTAYLFDDNTRVEMRVVETIFFTETGARNAVLNSREGTYNTRTNNMEARGNVVVVSVDGRTLKTQELRYSQSRNEITSDSAFVLTDSTQQMSGIAFVSDPNMNNVRCLKACAGSAGMVTLPGSPGDTARVAPPPHRTQPQSTLPPSAGYQGAVVPGGTTNAASVPLPGAAGSATTPPAAPHNGGAIGVNAASAAPGGRPAASPVVPPAAATPSVSPATAPPPASAGPPAAVPSNVSTDTLRTKGPAAPATASPAGASGAGQRPP